MKTPITITAMWLRRIGDKAQVFCEIDGTFRLAIEELADGSYSHIAEGNGAYRWSEDPIGEGEAGGESSS